VRDSGLCGLLEHQRAALLQVMWTKGHARVRAGKDARKEGLGQSYCLGHLNNKGIAAKGRLGCLEGVGSRVKRLMGLILLL
jgi:hypothetical protein